jgi:effector-binding domain-containing protein
MHSDFKVRDHQSLTVLSQEGNVTLANIGAAISAGLMQAYGFLGPTGATADAPPFVIYHGSPGGNDRPFDIEICVPVSRTVDPPTGWVTKELPAGTFASVVHIGPYDMLGTAYDELGAWIAREGFAIAGPPREVYMSEPSTPPGETRTVIEFPVVRSEATVPTAAS